jgi:hypothetical protein
VQKKPEIQLTGALTDGVLFKVNCFARILQAKSFCERVEDDQMDEIGQMSDGQRRADHRINRVPRRRNETMKRVVATLATFVLLGQQESHAAQKTIEWFDELSCSYSIKFDPKKYDEQSLRNTVDVIFTGNAFQSVSPDVPRNPTGPVNVRVERFQQLCERVARQDADLAVIDLPGIETYRKLKLEELDDGCKFGEVEIRAASGDSAALRSYIPSAAKCSRFIDGLEGKADIITVWREMINSRCQSFASPGMCRAEHFSDEGKPDAMERIRYDVLHYGWNNCSTAYLKVNQKQSNEIRRALEREFRFRFRVKRPACGD